MIPGERHERLTLAGDGVAGEDLPRRVEDADLQRALVEVESRESHVDASGCGAIEPRDRGDRDGPNGIYLFELVAQPGGPVRAVG